MLGNEQRGGAEKLQEVDEYPAALQGRAPPHPGCTWPLQNPRQCPYSTEGGPLPHGPGMAVAEPTPLHRILSRAAGPYSVRA